jgi:hypothetical protein
MVTDILDRPISPGDFIVFFNQIYEVLEIYKSGIVKVILLNKSKTTSPVKKYADGMCLLDKNDVLIWKLKGVS